MNINPGTVIIGLLLVLAFAGVIYVFGAWAVANMRRGRINEETDITYPDQPQSEADKQAVAEVREREQATGDKTVR